MLSSILGIVFALRLSRNSDRYAPKLVFLHILLHFAVLAFSKSYFRSFQLPVKTLIFFYFISVTFLRTPRTSENFTDD